MLKLLIYKTLTAFLTWRTEVIFLPGPFFAETGPQSQIADETVSGSALSWIGGFTKTPIRGRVGRQTIDREE
ncbi:hypothetical protein [Candidatus Aalborgicola defluviihabitans]|uniref:hypothetical protein n=1 Tax=Candidatus Aalborgicola defluviihabitans TaxID=3386187 RepID=UPI001D66D9D9|nr:hypothetical protein [Burkholderiales bacterium]MBK7281968.1 hypothetical protein [Burkholderiales bacterium]MBK7315130.1 hypothetical protein [Burkholderiales bacterium]